MATPHAHDARIVLIDDLLRKPSIYGPASRLLGEAFTNYVDNLPQRLRIGENVPLRWLNTATSLLVQLYITKARKTLVLLS
ncbi:MAG: hypothetical protein D8G53_13490 [Candidatus Saccharimonas sp.]|nr:MAG: hypothetical protein D8G53_13490 [Candidatus Saccharimonas sp.]